MKFWINKCDDNIKKMDATSWQYGLNQQKLDGIEGYVQKWADLTKMI